MPIRINLLAESKLAEEQRRNDPVKRAVFVGGFFVFLIVLWATTLQLKIIVASSNLGRLEARWKDVQKSYDTAIERRRLASDAETKLAALQQMTTNRFLWGNVLNALQHSLSGIEGVQLTRMRSDQAYVLTEEVKGRRTEGGFLASRPASSTERISITLEATDANAKDGGNVGKFKDAIAAVPYFKDNLQKTNGVLLTSLSAPQQSANGGTQVAFTLQCFFPEKVR
jgi:hypothetical protein